MKRPLTKCVTREEVLLGFASIEHCCPKKGINWEVPVVAVPERSTVVPATKGLGSANSRTMRTSRLGSVRSRGVGDFRDVDVIVEVDELDSVSMV